MEAFVNVACWICTETLLSCCAIDLDIYLGFAVSLLFLSICFGALLACTDRSYSLIAPGRGAGQRWHSCSGIPPGRALTFRVKLIHGAWCSTALSQQRKLFSSFQAQFSAVVIHRRQSTPAETSLKYPLEVTHRESKDLKGMAIF